MALKKPSEYFKQKEEKSSIDESVQQLVKTPELNTFSDAFESFKNNLSKIEVLSEFSETLDNYRVNVERVNYLSEKVEDIQTEIQNLLRREDLDRAMMSQLIVVEQSILDVQNKVKGINEKNLIEIRLDVSNITKSVNEFLEVEVPKYKKLVVDSELRTDNRYKELEQNVNQTLEGIGEFVDNKYHELTETLQGINESSLSGIVQDFKILNKSVSQLKEEEIPKYKGFIVETERKSESKLNEFEEKLKDTVNEVLDIVSSVEEINSSKIEEVETLQKKIDSGLKNVEEHKKELDKRVVDLEVEILKNESHIKKQNDYIENIQEEVRDVISKLQIEEIEEKNSELVKKVNYLEEIFEKFNQETLTEGLLNEPPEVKSSDPLTPLDQNFVTLDQLQQHYRLFINRIQQQLSTLGGGGETQLKYLDDIVGIATNASAYDNKFLKYNHSIRKFEFVTVSGGSGTQTLDQTLQLGNTSSLGLSVGVTTVTSLNVDSVANIDTNSITFSSSSPTQIYSFSASQYRSARLQVQITQGTDYQTSDLLVIHNGTIANIIEYASISTNDYLGTFDVSISGGNVLLQVLMGSSSSTTIKVVSQTITL